MKGKVDLKPGLPVPPEYVGVWKRTLLRTPKIEDTTSQVYWLQTQSWHADIRVPAGRSPCKGKTALDQLSREELLELGRQQGFCGVTSVDGDICRWLRQYDFQPPSGANDVGRMEFHTPDRVFEYGVEADYFEIWERVPGSQGEAFAVELSVHPLSLLLVAGQFFMRVCPRRENPAQATSLIALAGDKDAAALRGLLDFEISFGRRPDPDTFQIELSTLPWMEGKSVRLPGTHSGYS